MIVEWVWVWVCVNHFLSPSLSLGVCMREKDNTMDRSQIIDIKTGSIYFGFVVQFKNERKYLRIVKWKGFMGRWTSKKEIHYRDGAGYPTISRTIFSPWSPVFWRLPPGQSRSLGHHTVPRARQQHLVPRQLKRQPVSVIRQLLILSYQRWR